MIFVIFIKKTEEEEQMAIPVAVQIYSVRDDAKTNLYGTLKKIKEIGCKYVAIPHVGVIFSTKLQRERK